MFSGSERGLLADGYRQWAMCGNCQPNVLNSLYLTSLDEQLNFKQHPEIRKLKYGICVNEVINVTLCFVRNGVAISQNRLTCGGYCAFEPNVSSQRKSYISSEE